jgi:hypothetical protein
MKKSEIHSTTDRESPWRECWYNSTLSLISVLGGCGWLTPRPVKGQSTHFIRGWIGPRAGPDECGERGLSRDSITGPSIQ